MIPLDKVHMVRSHTHLHVTGKWPQCLGHGKDMLRIPTIDHTGRWGWPPTTQWTPSSASQGYCNGFEGFGTKRRQKRSRVTSSLDTLWSGGCWSAPPAELCWYSRRRHFARGHGNCAAWSGHSLHALVLGSISGGVLSAGCWPLLHVLDFWFHCCCRCWKTAVA